ncbi:YebC/PmpR family DNA-binding transcriptional regulator [Patescibacteria group bacterium]|nr:MAG: YebC/PmpR family DNA-binding transcriptional regulator [Patescibacteria group bacterium]
MARHSHWHNIQLKKGKADAKRAGVFSKLAKNITMAAKEGGGDASFNFKLRMAVDAAKAVNMPNDNIQRAIDRGTGGGEGAVLEEVIYEGFGPAGVALMIVCVTDNRNRTVAEVKTLASKNGGNVGASGSVAWMFDRKGMVTVGDATGVKDRDVFELTLIEAGASDIQWDADACLVLSAPNDLAKVAAAIEAQALKADDVRIGYVPKTSVAVEDAAAKEQLDKLLEILDDHDDVEAVYTNEG